MATQAATTAGTSANDQAHWKKTTNLMFMHLGVWFFFGFIIHMFVNRLSRSAGPEHELVVYDYLVQLYRSQLARSAHAKERRRVVTEG